MRPLAAGMIAAALVVGGDLRADDGGAGRRARVVVHVGPARIITVGEIEDRIGALPPFQRATFGADAATVRREIVRQVFVPEALDALGAQAEHLDQRLPASRAIERARSQAAIRAVRERVGPASAISAADVEKYYADNRDHYSAPERLQLWRILCKTRDDAQAVLDELKKEPTPKEFGTLARERSIDKGTNLRAGNLGFVAPDGTSDEPDLRLDTSIVRAAQDVRDGDLVPAPVPEGEYFAVVWRRGTIAATRRSVDQAGPQIRDTLWKARVKEQTDALVARLRVAKLRELNEAPLALLGTTPSLEPDGGRSARPAASADGAP